MKYYVVIYNQINYGNLKILQVSQYQSTASLYADISGFTHRGIETFSICIETVFFAWITKRAVKIQELNLSIFCSFSILMMYLYKQKR